MPEVHRDPAALRALQTDIYRERVRRARGMTEEQRFADGLELTDSVFERMLDGAMWQKGITDREEGWAEVRRRLERLSRVQDAGRYFPINSTAPPGCLLPRT
jgi:hypothetical protein